MRNFGNGAFAFVKGFLASATGFLAGGSILAFLYNDARNSFAVHQSDMDFGSVLFAAIGAFLGAASGLMLLVFCTKSYRYTGITALAIGLLFSPVGCYSCAQVWDATRLILDAAPKRETDADFTLTLCVPVLVWWLAFFGCGVAALWLSCRKPSSDIS